MTVIPYSDLVGSPDLEQTDLSHHVLPFCKVC